MSYDGSTVIPVPRPTSTRPFETWSRVRTCRANIAGFRRGIWVTQVVSRSDEVAAASPVSAVHDSNHGLGGFVQSTK